MKDIDIRKHEFVPKHVILNEKEREEVLKKYKIALKQLPRILATDPVIKLLNGQPSDVVKIIRKGSNNTETVFYRVVVKG